jgi:serine/threonine protein kinase
MAESKGDGMESAYAKLGIDVNEGGGMTGGGQTFGNPWGNWGVQCYQAQVVQCHIENLPPGSRPGNSKVWDKCLQSTSGHTYMFVRTIRDAIHGKVRHAYLLQETSPGSRRYNFLQTEQRAIKEMGLASINSGQCAEDPRTEIRVQDQLGTPGCNFVCGIHECTFDNRNVYSVLPFCDGGELFSRIEESGALPEQQCKMYFRQIMTGMLYIHQKGICHRDMSLENVLLADGGQVARIIDFGLCLQMTADQNGLPTPFPPSGAVGKMFYMAPEVNFSVYSVPRVA